MNPILFAVLVVAGIGLVVGIVLAVASAVMAVPKDEKAEAVLEVLPGANCGACGFQGARAMQRPWRRAAQSRGCAPRRRRNDKAVSEILGTQAEKTVKRSAVVHCSGSLGHTENKMDYQGISLCRRGTAWRRSRKMLIRLYWPGRLQGGLRIRCDYRMQRAGGCQSG